MALAGCNQIFGLGKTQPAVYDAPIDAPYRCPPGGTGTAPAFSDLFVQVVPEGDCENYTTSLPAGNVTVATCSTTTGAQMIETSAIDAASLDLTMLTPSAFDPKLSPEGDELWIGRTDASNNGVVSVYTPAGAGWQLAFDAYTVAGLPYVSPSTPMKKGTPRRELYTDNSEVHELDEYAPGKWRDTGMTFTAPTLGVLTFDSVPQLSPDGLRIVFSGRSMSVDPQPAIFYADRPDLSHPFGTAIRLVGPPAQATYPFMTYDCSRLYFSGLGSILYVPQQ
ncbi:MAG: hypothetical protein ACM31C_27660 [Acidobacteriota bacterium]